MPSASLPHGVSVSSESDGVGNNAFPTYGVTRIPALYSGQPRGAWEKAGIQSQKAEVSVWVKHAGP